MGFVMHRPLFALAGLVLLAFAGPAWSAEEVTFRTTIKDHRFTPDTIEVPANTRFKLFIKNEDATAEEFEMKSPKREKVVRGGREESMMLGPFKPGTYEFVGEHNEKTAKGRFIAK
jgi:hypothetical protein